VRTTLNIDDDLVIAAKSLAQERKVPMGEIISGWIRNGLNSNKAFASKSGLPVFAVGPSAQPITLEHVKRHEDDL
jgi:hypothetical protein